MTLADVLHHGSAQLRSAWARVNTLLSDLQVSELYGTIARFHGDQALWFVDQELPFRGFSGDVLTANQLRDLGYKIANALIGADLQRNERVLIFKRNHPDYLLYTLSTVAAGGIPVVANAGTGWDFAVKLQEVTGARFIITDDATLARDPQGTRARELAARGVQILLVSSDNPQPHPGIRHFFADIERAAAVAPPARIVGDDTPIAMFHTSGTTGVPKCCVWNQRNVRRIWRIGAATTPIGPGSRGLIATPFSHAIFTAMQPPFWLTGVPIYLMSKFDPVRCLQTIEQRRISHFMGFPYTFMRMAAEDLSAFDLSSMRLWCTGADKAHAAHIAKFIAVGGARWRGAQGSFFVDTYGSTEIAFGGVMKLWTPGSTPRPCVQGRPMPREFQVRVVDRLWRDVPRGTVGRILVNSSTYFAGYWNRHDAWAESRIDGWWWPGDVGRVNDDGDLEFLDREVDVVQTSAGPVYGLPFEERMLADDRIMEAVVFERVAERGPEAHALVVPRGWLRAAEPVLDDVAIAAIERDLLARANASAAGPGLAGVRAVALDQIPLGVTGKVLKRRLRTELPALEVASR
jgi:long-chain acyl-CoA synthetase